MSTTLPTYLFIIELSEKGWSFLTNYDGDRTEAGSEIVEKLGGKVISYHYGLGNGKIYGMLSLPDKETAQAISVTRLSTGFVKSFEIIELVSGAEMVGVYKKRVLPS